MASTILQTARMRLREMTWEDAPNLLGIFSDAEAMRYYRATKDEAETMEWVQRNLTSYKLWRLGLWIAELKATSAFVGQCGLVMQRVEDRPEVEVGYLFLRKFWGQGLATEAALACRDYGFHQLEYPRLISLIDSRNKASIRVAEKVGMQFEKEVEMFEKRVCMYAIECEALANDTEGNPSHSPRDGIF